MFEEFVRSAKFLPLNVVLKKVWNFKRQMLRRKEGEKIILRNYYKLFGRHLNTKNPITFTQKIHCRMLSWNRYINPQVTECSDKYLVRYYVASKVGEEHLTRLFWHGENPLLIPFDSLPKNYVIKTNHASSQVILVKGSVNKEESFKLIKTWLKNNYYWKERESQYYGIKPQVLVEELLNDGTNDGPLDYRFWCFHGTPELIQVDNHRHNINPFFDLDWNPLELSYRLTALPITIEKPTNLNQMISVASSLSADYDFVRVDLYNVRGKIYFGELTFTPVAGHLKFQPEHWDLALGGKWRFSD